LFGYSLLLSIVPVLVSGLFLAHTYSNGIREEVYDNQQMTLKQLKYQVETFLYNLERSSLQIANDPIVGKSLRVGVSMTDPVALETTLEMIDRIRNYRSYADVSYHVSLVYLNYDHLYSNQYGIMPMSDFRYLSLLRNDPPPQHGSQIIPPNLYRDQPNMMLIRSVQTSAAPAEGYLLMEVDANRFYDFFRSLEPNHGGKFLIADNENRIVMSEDMSEIGSKANFWPELRIDRLAEEASPNTIRFGETDYQVSMLTSSSNEWRYVAITPVAVLMEKIGAIHRWAWGITALLLFIWITLSLLGAKKFSFSVLQIFRRLPVSKRDNDIFESIADYIDQTTENNHHLHDRIQFQEPGYREHLLLQLLHGDISARQFLARTNPSDPPFDQPWHCVCIAEADDFNGFAQSYRAGDRALIMYAWSKLMQEICEERYACMCVRSGPGQITFIIGMGSADEETESRIRSICDRIKERVRQHLKFSISIAIGGPSSSLSAVSKEFDESLLILRYRHWLGREATVARTDILASDSFRDTSGLIVRYEEETLSAIKQGDFVQAGRAANDLFRLLPVTGHLPDIGYFAHLIGSIDRLMAQFEGERIVFDCNFYEQWNTFKSASEAAAWFETEYLPHLQSRLAAGEGWRRKQIVEQAIQFIHDYIETDISLQQTADRFGLPTYQLSRLFKEETGKNFLDYVIERRISKAKEWLIHSDMPIKEMTERLCYATTQNFTRVFKQMTGVPPGKYRDDYRNARNGGNSGLI
jgi:AraC-like DNA-binding protein